MIFNNLKRTFSPEKISKKSLNQTIDNIKFIISLTLQKENEVVFKINSNVFYSAKEIANKLHLNKLTKKSLDKNKIQQKRKNLPKTNNTFLRFKSSETCTLESLVNEKYLPQVLDQGKCGTCTTFAIAGAMSAIFNRFYNYPSSDVRHTTLSPQYFMDCLGRSNCCGTYSELVSIYTDYKINEDKNDLFPVLPKYPYLNFVNEKCEVTIFNDREKCYLLNETNSIHISNVINKIEEVDYSDAPKNLIIRELNTYGPMVVTFIINKKALLFSFAFYRDGIIKDGFPFGMGGDEYYELYGAHSMILYGYEEKKYHYPTWLLRNSWGIENAPTVLFDGKEHNPFGLFDCVTKFYHYPEIKLPNN